ncbi:ABC transporter substrate-binding protein [Brachybacterium sp. P6-10-X1]|uniref:peptide ABC transporter substrate-binding protein n=1 Tax=Brachybacterium sp. P6-10-X1 TaxID=1903186 RepID=UPI0009F93461|nr:ABC transporter substrate-binding protein [Brachybacterium sp. P6-10-X1]
MAISRRSMMLGSAAGGVSALALAACGNGGEDGGSGGGSDGGGEGGNPILANGTEPQNPLIPTNTNEVGGGRIVQNVFAGLVSYDAEGTQSNEVAASIETEDSQTYTITLNEGWTFSDGTDVTAQSFVDAWNYGANASNAQLSGYFFEPIEGYEDLQGEDVAADATLTGLTAEDDLTLVVKLVSPQADFPIRLGYAAFSPLPKAFFDDPEGFGEKPIGNGPYTLTSWEHEVSAELAVNPDYAGNRKPANEGVRFTFYQDFETAYNDLLSAGVDVIDNIPASALTTFEDELGDRAINQPAAVFQSFTIHMEDPNFSGEAGSLRRQALSLAIDRQTICDAIFQGTSSPATDFSSPVVNGYSDSIPGSEVLQFDPEKAKQLWDEAEGIQPFEGPFTLAYNADGDHAAWVDAVTNQLLNNLGIEASGKSYPTFAALRDEVLNRTITGAFRSGWQADYPSVFNFLGPLYGSAAAEGRGSNDGDYMNDEFDQLLAEGLAATDEETAFAKAQAAEELLFRDLPAIPLWNDNVTGGSAETVENVTFGWDSQPQYHEITKTA